jgi:hypothetical protein
VKLPNMHWSMTRALVVVTITMLLSACGSTHVADAPAQNGSPASTAESQSVDPIAPPVTSPSTAGLNRWEGFPVAGQPRPIVLLSGPLHWPENGFVNDSEKIALSYGGARPPVSYPTAPDTAAGYQLIDPSSAFRTLIDVQRNGDDSTEAIQATGVTLGMSTFATDRGQKDLPAWIFQFDGATAVAVAAVHPKFFFAPLGDKSTSGPAGIPGGGSTTLSSDGQTLTVAFTGAAEGQGPCTADYAAVLEERSNVVGLSVTTTRRGTGQVEECAAGGFKRTVSATLASPLGDRVLVDSTSGDPIAVTGS